jgi:hypothetical protein
MIGQTISNDIPGKGFPDFDLTHSVSKSVGNYLDEASPNIQSSCSQF